MVREYFAKYKNVPSEETLIRQVKKSIDRSIIEYDMSRGTPYWDLHAKIQSVMRSSQSRYPPSMGLPGLRLLVAQYLREKYGFDAHPYNVLITSSGMSALSSVLSACNEDSTHSGRVLIPTPAWSDFANVAKLAARFDVDFRPLRKYSEDMIPDSKTNLVGDELFDHDFDEILKSMKNVRAVVLSLPGNPTGTIINLTRLKILHDECINQTANLVLDLTYDSMVFDKKSNDDNRIQFKYGPSDTLLDSSKIILVGSFSKTYGMTGARIGWVFCNDTDALNAIFHLHNAFNMCANDVGQRMAIMAIMQNWPDYFKNFNCNSELFEVVETPLDKLSDEQLWFTYEDIPRDKQDDMVESLHRKFDRGFSWFESKRKKLEKRRNALYEKLRETGDLLPVKSEGSYYMWVGSKRIAEMRKDSLYFASQFCEKTGILGVPGEAFDEENRAESKNYIRICFGRLSDSLFNASLDRIKEWS
ncbi:MAG: pyridoxal phosphate-dependent aminotransferase [Candidatus Odinarchaeota archaeon]